MLVSFDTLCKDSIFSRLTIKSHKPMYGCPPNIIKSHMQIFYHLSYFKISLSLAAVIYFYRNKTEKIKFAWPPCCHAHSINILYEPELYVAPRFIVNCHFRSLRINGANVAPRFTVSCVRHKSFSFHLIKIYGSGVSFTSTLSTPSFV